MRVHVRERGAQVCVCVCVRERERERQGCVEVGVRVGGCKCTIEIVKKRVSRKKKESKVCEKGVNNLYERLRERMRVGELGI